MVVLRRISDQRRRQLLGYALPHLEEGEEVEDFARARDPGSKRKGFVYLTDRRLLVAWKDAPDAVGLRWGQISGWALDGSKSGGPLLRVSSAEGDLAVELRTATPAMTTGVRTFVRRLAASAPSGTQTPGEADGKVAREPSTPGRLARRVLITILGVALIGLAPVIVILPGPWSILLVIAGLALLANEYDWAEDALDWARQSYKRARDKLRARRDGG